MCTDFTFPPGRVIINAMNTTDFLQKTGFLFDFDGVICDSEKFHHRAWQQVAGLLGVEFTKEDYVPFQSTGRRVVITELCRRAHRTLTEDLFAQLSEKKSLCFAAAIRDVGKKDLIPGAEDFIKLLFDRNKRLAVASSASTAKEMLDTLDLSRYFSAVVDGKNGLAKKPDPAVFLAACARLSLSPADCVVFEDSPAGVQAGLAGGFSVVGIGENVRKFNIPIFADFYQILRA